MNDDNGLISIRGRHGVAGTVRRFTDAARGAGLLIFAELDHGRNAVAIGMPLRPTVLIIFGNPKGGTPLMQLNQASGIDLPFKARVWEDEQGVTWLTYNDPGWVAARHALGPAAEPSVAAINAGMNRLVAAATS